MPARARSSCKSASKEKKIDQKKSYFESLFTYFKTLAAQFKSKTSYSLKKKHITPSHTSLPFKTHYRFSHTQPRISPGLKGRGERLINM